ncbi:MAG: DUF7065 domain-containing protein [Acidimicrobiales bacterium]
MPSFPSVLDEVAHEPDPRPEWEESWQLDFWTEDAELGGYVRLGLWPNSARSWYWACLVGRDRPLVTVIEHDAPLPKPPGLEIRASGLWADLIVQTAMEHMTVGLEAFGVAIDDPSEVYGKGWGDREPIGFDLEWESEGPGVMYDGQAGYEIPCRAHGEILVGSETIDFDGWGRRSHRWGIRQWWDREWSWASCRLGEGTTAIGEVIDGGVSTQGFIDTSDVASGCAISASHDERGLVDSARIRLGDLYLAAEPVAWAPVAVQASDGRTSHVERSLCRYAAGDGRSGAGWMEFNRPQ